jgi:acetolactate synthase-1/2/3 large subunit
MLRQTVLIDRARRPLIFAGNGVIRGNASAALRVFSRTIGLPLVNTFMAKGCVPADSELSLGTVGLQVRDYVSCGFDRADLVLAVGYDPVEYAPTFWNPERDKTIIHLDFTTAEVDSHYQPAVEVVADIREALELLTDLCRVRRDPAPSRLLHEWIQKELDEGSTDDGFPIKPQRILHDIRSVLAPSDLVISDVGAHKLWVARLYPAVEPNTVLISNGYAAMGIALPGAVAAKLVAPERRVLAISGDGGVLMNVQELETAVRLGLNIVTLVFRDDAYGSIRMKQLHRYGRELGVAFGNPDFARLAEAFGATGIRVEAAGELAPALKRAFESPGPVMIEVPVDYRENLKLTERMGQIVCPV